MRLHHTVAALLIATLVLGTTTISAASAQELRPRVSAPSAFDAPIGQPGGAMNPYASCGGDYSVTPRMQWTITSDETGEITSFDWFDAFPGMQFPRLEVGTYTSRVVVWCRGKKASRTDPFSIAQKTKKSTISFSEFRRVKRGMTLTQVKRIVGNRGVYPSRYQGTTTRTFHQMQFWSWSVIEFRDGRVSRKSWNVGHD